MPDFSDLNDSQLDLVRKSLWRRQYYLLTGSGTSLDSKGPHELMRSISALKDRLCELNDLPKSKSIQQAYSLLSKDQVSDNLTKPYTCTKPGETVKGILEFPWRRIYTFNIDNCLEIAAGLKAKAIGDFDPEFEFINYDDDFTDTSPEIALSVVHLHGFVEQESSGYIFSHLEYAKNINRANSWMLTLTQLIKVEPFIIAGTTLDEIDVTYYLEQRNSKSSRSDVAPSILIEPYPDRLTTKLCDTHEFYLFKGTLLDFFNHMTLNYDSPPTMWPLAFSDGLDALDLQKRERIAFGATFEFVPKQPAPDNRLSPFLLGAPATWSTLEARADIPREVTVSLLAEIQKFAKDREFRVFLLFDDLGSGKSALLKRLALNISRTEKNVYNFTGHEIAQPETAAKVLSRLNGHLFIFVDNWADHQAYFIELLSKLSRTDVIIVAAERNYRRPYIEDGLSDEDIAMVQSQLDLEVNEARRLIIKFQEEGISSRGVLNSRDLNIFAREISGSPISIASCRIQKNFQSFDQIVESLLRECSDEEIRVYATVGVARFCYSGGVSRSVLFDAQKTEVINSMVDVFSKLPIVYSNNSNQYIIPARAAIADRVLTILQKKDEFALSEIFISLANALSPRVNRRQIRARAPAAKLAGALLDFDRLVRRFINGHAEHFYDSIKDMWSWNSRYWEQCALLKLDRYLVDRSDPALLQEGIQNARYAYSIERHPLSLTTLAKMLFAAMENGQGNTQTLFEEGWLLIVDSIDIESKWTNIKGTAFVVCFKGVLSYAARGGTLSGSQADKLRDIVAVTYQRRLRDRGLNEIREKVSELI